MPEHRQLPQRPEACTKLFCEQLWLFPGGEVAASVELVVVDEVVVGPLGPATGGLVALVWKDADGRRDGDVDGEEAGDLGLPVETSRRDRRVRQPVEGDVVKDVVACELAGGLSLNDLAE